MSGRRGACPATTRCRSWSSLRRTSASGSSASITRTSPTMRGAFSAATAIRSSRSAATTNGRAAIEWGVYGVPETFLVGRDGRIAYKLVGPITADNLDRVLKPEIEKASKPVIAIRPLRGGRRRRPSKLCPARAGRDTAVASFEARPSAQPAAIDFQTREKSICLVRISYRRISASADIAARRRET